MWAGEVCAVPGEGGGDDGIVVASAWGAVAVAAVGQLLECVVLKFVEEDGVIEQGDFLAFDGEGQGFDEGGFGFGGGIEGFYGQAGLVESFDIGFADGVGFCSGPQILDTKMQKLREDMCSMSLLFLPGLGSLTRCEFAVADRPRR